MNKNDRIYAKGTETKRKRCFTMSMRYYSYDDYGVYLNDDELLYLTRSLLHEKYPHATLTIVSTEGITVDDNGEETWYDFQDCLDFADSIITSCSGFTGDYRKIFDGSFVNEDFDEALVIYIPLLKYPSFYEKAYEDFGDMIWKHREAYQKYLPSDFDWENRFIHIVGTVFG